jgi:hypothetical protein
VSEVLVVDGIVDEALRRQLLSAISAEELGLAGGSAGSAGGLDIAGGSGDASLSRNGRELVLTGSGGEWDVAVSADPRVWVRGALSDVPIIGGEEIPEGEEEEEEEEKEEEEVYPEEVNQDQHDT